MHENCIDECLCLLDRRGESWVEGVLFEEKCESLSIISIETCSRKFDNMILQRSKSIVCDNGSEQNTNTIWMEISSNYSCFAYKSSLARATFLPFEWCVESPMLFPQPVTYTTMCKWSASTVWIIGRIVFCPTKIRKSSVHMKCILLHKSNGKWILVCGWYYMLFIWRLFVYSNPLRAISVFLSSIPTIKEWLAEFWRNELSIATLTII